MDPIKLSLFKEDIKNAKITFNRRYMKYFFLLLVILPSFHLGFIFFLRLILERARVHDDGVNHFAPECCRCIQSTITISFFFSTDYASVISLSQYTRSFFRTYSSSLSFFFFFYFLRDKIYLYPDIRVNRF